MNALKPLTSAGFGRISVPPDHGHGRAKQTNTKVKTKMTLSQKYKKQIMGVVLAAETTLAATFTFAHHEGHASEHLPRRSSMYLLEIRRESRSEPEHFEWPLAYHEEAGLEI